MSTINTSSYESDLLPGLVKEWFSIVPQDYEPLYSQMMKVQTSDQNYEIHGTNTGFAALVKKGQQNSLVLDTTQEAYKPRYEQTTYALGFAITKEAIRDGHAFKDAKIFTQMLARSARVTKEIIGASILNNAGTSGKTMLGGDGALLASASHPTKYGNQSNILASAADLSEAALEAVRTQIENAVDNRGLRIKLMCKDLIINPAQRALAHRILKSEKEIDSLQNANFLKDSGTIKRIIVNPYLSSTTQWNVTTTLENGLIFLLRQDAEMDTDNDFMTKNGLYSVDMRCCAGWDDFRGVYISLGT